MMIAVLNVCVIPTGYMYMLQKKIVRNSAKFMRLPHRARFTLYNLSAINFGHFLWQIFLPHGNFAHTEIAAIVGLLLYDPVKE